MANRIIGVFFFFFLLSSCSSVEFVYNKNSAIENFKNNTKIVTDYYENKYLISYLSQKLGNEKINNKYTLSISSKTLEKITSTNQDQSAASYYINNTVKYSLVNNLKNCIVHFDTIDTGFTYNAKSEGYDFGTDKSIEKSKMQSLQHNANVFLNKISSLPKEPICKNENKI